MMRFPFDDYPKCQNCMKFLRLGNMLYEKRHFPGSRDDNGFDILFIYTGGNKRSSCKRFEIVNKFCRIICADNSYPELLGGFFIKSNCRLVYKHYLSFISFSIYFA